MRMRLEEELVKAIRRKGNYVEESQEIFNPSHHDAEVRSAFNRQSQNCYFFLQFYFGKFEELGKTCQNPSWSNALSAMGQASKLFSSQCLVFLLKHLKFTLFIQIHARQNASNEDNKSILLTSVAAALRLIFQNKFLTATVS